MIERRSPHRDTDRNQPWPSLPAQRSGSRRVSGLVGLQRTAGNKAVATLIAQRASVQRVGDETPVAKALRTRSVSDAKDASNELTGASEGDKFGLIDILRKQGWVGPLDEYALERIWRSFGENLPAVAESHLTQWKDCVNKGAELQKLPAAKAYITAFELDAKARAAANLRSNEALTKAEVERLSIDPEVRVPDEAFIAPPPDQLRRLQETQGLAKSAAATMTHLLWMKENINYAGERFDPHKKPALDFDLGDGRSLWSMARDEWAKGEALLAMIANSSPALFVAIGAATPTFERESVPGSLSVIAETDPAKNPQAAKQGIQILLKSVLKNISLARENLPSTDPRVLQPVHSQLKQGTGASGTDWSRPFARWVIDQEAADYQSEQMWKKLALESAAFAALVAAEIATFGGATFFVATGIGLAASAADAVTSQQQSSDLQALGGSAAHAESLMVHQGQVTAAEAAAEAAALALVINALAVGVGGAMRAGEAALQAENARRLAVLQQRYADRIAADAQLQKQIDALEKVLATPASPTKATEELRAVEAVLGTPAPETGAALPVGPPRLTGGGNAVFDPAVGVGARGMDIEGAMAKVYRRMTGGIRRMPAGFKGIDFVSGGTTTVTVTADGVRSEAIVGASGISEKTLDLLTLATREPKSPAAITKALRGHIRDLFQFEHYQLKGIEVSDLSSRVLNVYVGPGAPTAAQSEAIQATAAYASQHEVIMNIVVF